MNDIDSIHQLELMLLDNFIQVCDKHSIQWFADSGTLLGAVRAGEMIPWDDDIDIVMLRPEYDKLLKVADEEFKYPFFFQTNENDRYTYCFSKLRFCNSAIFEINSHTKNDYQAAFNKGIFIDIFVLDSVPDNKDEFDALQMMLRYVYNYSSAKSYDKTYCKDIVKSKEFFKLLNWMLRENSKKYEKSEFIANLYFNKSSKYRDVILFREDYSEFKEISFKGLTHKLKIPVGYERILSTWYGSDWKIPKKVESCHSIDKAFYDTENSYIKYENLSFEEYMKLFK